MTGDEAGSFLKVIDDAANTGGYLVLTSEKHDFSVGFDNWVENLAGLKDYFAESKWIVSWE